MTKFTCDNCESEAFFVEELCWGNITLVCRNCNHKHPLADDGHVYADFGVDE